MQIEAMRFESVNPSNPFWTHDQILLGSKLAYQRYNSGDEGIPEDDYFSKVIGHKQLNSMISNIDQSASRENHGFANLIAPILATELLKNLETSPLSPGLVAKSWLSTVEAYRKIRTTSKNERAREDRIGHDSVNEGDGSFLYELDPLSKRWKLVIAGMFANPNEKGFTSILGEDSEAVIKQLIDDSDLYIKALREISVIAPETSDEFFRGDLDQANTTIDDINKRWNTSLPDTSGRDQLEG